MEVYCDIRNNSVEYEYEYYEELDDNNVEMIFVGFEKKIDNW